MKRVILFSTSFGDFGVWAEAIRALRPDLELVDWPDVTDPDAVEFALLWKLPDNGLGQYRNLKGIQSLGAGVNQLNLADLPSGVPLTRMVDPGLTQTMVDYAVAATFRHFRGFDGFERDNLLGRWHFAEPRQRLDYPVGILGAGVLGGAVAMALRDLGFPVSIWSRSPRHFPTITAFAGQAELPAFLGRQQLVICVLPLTQDTTGILNRATFGMMPAGACLVNMGRGAHLVETDLLAAIESGHLAGATLDVAMVEPLPPGDPLYRCPKILMTPHVAGVSNPRTAVRSLIENFDRATAGLPLLNAVDPILGY